MTGYSGTAIEAVAVHQHYPQGERPALDAFHLSVPTGSVYALLGPNGAGKTTAIKVLTTLLTPDSGRAAVAGHDVHTDAHRVRQQIGLVGQNAAVDEILSGRSNLVMLGRLNGLSRAAARERAVALLDEFGLEAAADRPVSGYSGGMRRRLDLAVALIVAPPVLFVDEPTTGLDPAVRRDVWTAVRRLVERGTTVLLTTQYLEEADALADRVGIMRDGAVVAEGTPAELKSAVGSTRIELTLAGPADVAATRLVAHEIASGDGDVRTDGDTVSIPVADEAALVDICARLSGRGVVPIGVGIRRPTLDDVFLHFHQPITTPTPAEVAR